MTIAAAHPLVILAYNINLTNLQNTEVHARLTGSVPTLEIIDQLQNQMNLFEMNTDGGPCTYTRQEGVIFFFMCPPGSTMTVIDKINYSLINDSVSISSTLFFTTFQDNISEPHDGKRKNIFAIPQKPGQDKSLNLTVGQQEPLLTPLTGMVIAEDIRKETGWKAKYGAKIIGMLFAAMFLMITIYFFRRNIQKKKKPEEKSIHKYP